MSGFGELLKIQKQQLEEWKSKLNDECFNALREWTKEQNMSIDYSKPATYEVVRGVTLDNFIMNWQPESK